MSRETLEAELERVIQRYGEWTYDIPLPHGLWTRGNEGDPHTRLRRVVQVARDLARKPLDECRVLDLGCLDGQFAIEFALHGATVIGVEPREANIAKAKFAGEALQLHNLSFVQGDVRNLTKAEHGSFDVIVCSGLLYHLNVPDVFTVVERLYDMVEDVTIIDTHISLRPTTVIEHDGKQYHGHEWVEHAPEDPEEVKAARSWAAWGNDTSFTFTRPSLVNLLARVGFSSVYECFNPPHLNFGQPGLEHRDRCTFVAVKGEDAMIRTSPAANGLEEEHPEGSLTYPVEPDRGAP